MTPSLLPPSIGASQNPVPFTSLYTLLARVQSGQKGQPSAAYLFRTNALGTQFDALITNEGPDLNVNWDEKWYSAAAIVEDGWIVELALPLRMLRIQPTASSSRVAGSLSPTVSGAFDARTSGCGWVPRTRNAIRSGLGLPSIRR